MPLSFNPLSVLPALSLSLYLAHPDVHETNVVRLFDVVLHEAGDASAELVPAAAIGGGLE